MVAISHGSLNSPLLGDCNENIQNSCSTGLHRDEVMIVVLSESQDDKIPDDSLANQSRSTFKQIHALNRTRSSDCLRGESRRRGHSIRNPIQKKSLVARAKYSARTDTWNFLYNLMIGLYMWPKWSWDAMKKNSNLTTLAMKQGLCAGLCSILCVVKIPKPFAEISSIALWAVMTTDLLYEANIGLSVSKGCNRVLGTLAAGCVGFGLNQVGLQLGPLYPYFMVFCVVIGGFIFRFFKGMPSLKEQWGYAFSVATMAFHFFIIYGYLDPERWTLPMLRFSMILLGFAMSSIVNIAFRPNYAGDTLHKLVAKNFETAACVFERCVEEYIKDTKLDHVPDILSGRCEDDKIHQSYHEVVMSDSDIDKLLRAVLWEPPHGKFFMGYPWHLYDDIADYLRYTLYDVIALDLCLRANIQAPKHLRDIFAQEMATIATECAAVLRTLGDSMKNMKKFSSENIMAPAEEAAFGLQSKIHQNTEVLLGSTPEPEHLLLGTSPSSQPSIYQPLLDQDDFLSPDKAGTNKFGTSPSSQPSIHQPLLNQDDFLSPDKAGTNKLGTSPSSQPSIHQPLLNQDDFSSPNKEGTNKSWKNTFLHRKSTLGPHWDGTLERISALSLVKFASLLIEVVSKLKFVVDCVEDLSEQAKFQACSN